MTRRFLTAVLLGASMLGSGRSLDGAEPLRMQVSPSVTREPALITVRIIVQSAAEDRYLQVAAESSEFYRSSQVQLNGKDTAPVQVFEFRNLPTGTYEITGVLVGTRGPRATVLKVARVEPSPGHPR